MSSKEKLEKEIKISDISEVTYYYYYDRKAGHIKIYMFVTVDDDIYFFKSRPTRHLLKMVGLRTNKLSQKPVKQRNMLILKKLQGCDDKIKLVGMMGDNEFPTIEEVLKV